MTDKNDPENSTNEPIGADSNLAEDRPLTPEEEARLEEESPYATALHEKDDAPEEPVVEAVQRKIRMRSRGRFFSDGWSTEASTVPYVLLALVMLFATALAWFLLGPSSFG